MKLKHLKLILKYLKQSWRNPFARVQYFGLALEVLIIAISFFLIKNPWFFLGVLVIILPLSEEFRMRYAYSIAKIIFPKEVEIWMQK